jgi:hypothetical protein
MTQHHYFQIVCILFFAIAYLLWYLAIKVQEFNQEQKEAEPFQEQERPYVNPAHFNEVMKHQAKVRKTMYRGKTKLS